MVDSDGRNFSNGYLAGDEVKLWGQSDLAAFVALCQVGFDQESLSEDDLELCLPRAEDAPNVVLGPADGMACAALRMTGGQAQLELLVTHPTRRRQGLARLLLLAAEDWARAHGASSLAIGGRAPVGLFSGVDLRWTAAISLIASMGYQSQGTATDLVCSTIQGARVASPAGVEVARVETDEQLDAVLEFVALHAPLQLEVVSIAARAGTAVFAQSPRGRGICCVAVHSIYRLGVIGPVVFAVAPDSTDPALTLSREHGGLLAAVLGLIRSDLAVAGLRTVEVLGEFSVADYVVACQASTRRVSAVFCADLEKPREE